MSVFSQVAMRKPRRNTFDLSHSHKLSCNPGDLIPIFNEQMVPGDSFYGSSAAEIKFAPLVFPLMHQVMVYFHFWFVPYRLLWPNWEKFITGGEDGLDASVHPWISLQGNPGTLADYLDVPELSGGGSNPQIAPFDLAAYQLIWNENYRDQNLQTEVSYELVDGDNGAIQSSLIQLRKRAWQHDYFTSALPWTQKGPEATIPLGGLAPHIYQDNATAVIHDRDGLFGSTGVLDLEVDSSSTTASQGPMRVDIGGGTRHSVNIDNTPNTFTDLSAATAATINELRRAFRLQEWLEKNARGGSRYVESIYSHFGVKSPDARLQRPEFVGGGQVPVQFSEVLQTSKTDNTGDPSALGNYAGHGVSVGKSGSFKYYAQEHGVLLGLMSVMPKTAYFQGIPKKFLYRDKFDYYWPEFAHIGEQEILNKEIYVDSADGLDDDTFGYTPRYAELKYRNDKVSGDFKESLLPFHWARNFNTRPLLNGSFIECDPDRRVFNVIDPEVDVLYCNVYNMIKAKRPMPYFGVPTI